MTLLKEHLLRIQATARRAVDPQAAVMRVLSRAGNTLHLADSAWNLATVERILLIAVGKAAVPMAEAAVHVVGRALTAGIVVTKYGHAAEHTLPTSVHVIEAGHPVPDAAGLAGTEAVTALLRTATSQDRVLLLLSGGASALLPSPAAGISLADLQAVTDALLRAGATIGEINTVRKHLSRLSGGQLARLAHPAPIVALILSDVVGDPPDVIASGPTAPDPTTYAAAQAVLARYHLFDAMPSSIVEHLEQGIAGRIAETPKPGDPLFTNVTNVIIGSNRLAALAAVAEAERLGYRALLLTTFMEGEAREVAKVAAALAKSIRAHGEPLQPPACLVWGGETTVTVRGQGKGGRNQELALAAALALEGIPDVGLLALATDGTDGPTDAAGAIIDGQTVPCARAAGWEPMTALLDNNAYPLLDAVGALLRTGPTGTNVNDIMVLIVTCSISS
ncbi:MAG TPA: glycerate kinase [Anaerolineae bacterium]|nr:glycerate kinase [Anaerolineae bacterium]HQH37849.1 glycerate kinase [Anaerolineae bacterium]